MWKLAAFIAVAFGMMVLAAACGAAGAPPVETTAGAFVIRDVELSDQFPDCSGAEDRCKALTGYQVLIVWLKRKDGSELDLEAQNRVAKDSYGAYVIASDGSRTELTRGMTGVARVHVGFEVPVSAHGFKLVWPGNPPIDLGK